MGRPDPERVWLGFAQAAVGGAMSINVEKDESQTWEQINSSLADDCASIADEMLERWRLRYEDDPKKPLAGMPRTSTSDAGNIDW